MLVIVSWVSFWLDKDAVPARVSLGVTTLLTMTTQASGINAKLPPVSYTKAVDVWIGACMGFIFGALLEFALVNYAGRMEFMEKEKQSKRRPTNHSSMMMHDPMSSGIGMPSMPPPTINFPPQNTAIPIPESAGQKFGPLIETTGCPECEAESHIHSSEYFDPNLAMAEKKISPPGDIRLQQDPFYDQMRPLVASPMDFQMSSMKIKKKRKSTRSGCCFCMNEFLRKYWYTEKSKRIDIFSRVVFPLGFFFFNGVYWAIYLSPQS